MRPKKLQCRIKIPELAVARTPKHDVSGFGVYYSLTGYAESELMSDDIAKFFGFCQDFGFAEVKYNAKKKRPTCKSADVFYQISLFSVLLQRVQT